MYSIISNGDKCYEESMPQYGSNGPQSCLPVSTPLSIFLPQWLWLNYMTCFSQHDISKWGANKILKSTCVVDLLSLASENSSATIWTNIIPAISTIPAKILYMWMRPLRPSGHSQIRRTAQPTHRMSKNNNVCRLKTLGLGMVCYTAKAN